MRLFKATYKDKNGVKQESQKWYVDFSDHLGIRHRIPGFNNKRTTKAFGMNIEALVNAVVAGQRPDRELENWLNRLPDSIISKFVKWGLVCGQRAENIKDPHCEKRDNSDKQEGP